MNSSLKKYFILASALVVIWMACMAYLYVHFTAQSDVVSQEIRANSRHVGQQVHEMFLWFEEKEEIFVTGPQSTEAYLPGATATINGKNLTKAVPIEIIRKLENEFQNGVTLRFVSNSPINEKSFPTAEDNTAIMAMASDGRQDGFTYLDDYGIYHYVRPVFASKSCLSCHLTVQSGDLLGAVVVETNPELYVLSQRMEQSSLVVYGVIVSSFVILFLYFSIVRLWKKNISQGTNLEYAKSMVDNMGHEMEMILGNVSRIIHGLQQDGNNPQRAEFLLALQSMNTQLANSTMKFQGVDKAASGQSYEEIFHVDTFFQQCLQMFHGSCQERNTTLKLEIDTQVPEYVLGDAFHLRQMVMRIVKECVVHTEEGGVQVRVRSAMQMASRFSSSDVEHMPIHLIIEVEDTGKGFVVSEELLQKYTSKGDKHYASRPIISLKPIAEVASKLNGSVKLKQNKSTGACFEMVAQVKLVSEDKVREGGSHRSEASTSGAGTSFGATNAVPTQGGVLGQSQEAIALQQAHSGLQQAHKGLAKANDGLEQMQNGVAALQDPKAKEVSKELQQVSAGLKETAKGVKQANQGVTQASKGIQVGTRAALLAESQSSSAKPKVKEGPIPSWANDIIQAHEKPNTMDEEALQEQKSLYEEALEGEKASQVPISVIIGDCGIKAFTEEHKSIFAEENIVAKLVPSANDIFHEVDNVKHNVSVVFLRELNDLDAIYTATRIRYLERLGAKPVAIVLIAEDIVEADMDVLRFFNISTVDKFPRDAHVVAKVARMAMRTQKDSIFQGGKMLSKTTFEGDSTKLFDVKLALETSNKDEKLIKSMCAMWVRFYPAQVQRLREFIRDGNQENLVRIMRSIKNSAGTVCLPMLWEEAHRIEKKLLRDEDVRYEKILALYEETFTFLKQYLETVE